MVSHASNHRTCMMRERNKALMSLHNRVYLITRMRNCKTLFMCVSKFLSCVYSNMSVLRSKTSFFSFSLSLCLCGWFGESHWCCEWFVHFVTLMNQSRCRWRFEKGIATLTREHITHEFLMGAPFIQLTNDIKIIMKIYYFRKKQERDGEETTDDEKNL